LYWILQGVELLVMVIVALLSPLPAHPPELVIATPSPDDAVAARSKLLPYAALSGDAVVTVIVWAIL
jgi:hypothetical protein